MERKLSFELDVDVSNAISGLKALQREAKKATQALAELKTLMNEVNGGERV